MYGHIQMLPSSVLPMTPGLVLCSLSHGTVYLPLSATCCAAQKHSNNQIIFFFPKNLSPLLPLSIAQRARAQRGGNCLQSKRQLHDHAASFLWAFLLPSFFFIPGRGWGREKLPVPCRRRARYVPVRTFPQHFCSLKGRYVLTNNEQGCFQLGQL